MAAETKTSDSFKLTHSDGRLDGAALQPNLGTMDIHRYNVDPETDGDKLEVVVDSIVAVDGLLLVVAAVLVLILHRFVRRLRSFLFPRLLLCPYFASSTNITSSVQESYVQPNPLVSSVVHPTFVPKTSTSLLFLCPHPSRGTAALL